MWLLRIGIFLVSMHVSFIVGALLFGRAQPYDPVVYTAKLPTHDEVRVVDVLTGFRLVLAEADSFGVVDVSRDGQILVTTHDSVGSILNRLNPLTGTLEAWVHGVDDNAIWSPDGTQVAYRRYYFGGGVYIVTAGRWPPRSLGISATGITWSPDGTHIAYSYWNLESNQEEIRLINPRTGDDQLLVGWRKPVNYMRWSPDGRYLAIMTVSGEFHLLDVAAQSFAEHPFGNAGITAPHWSADGLQLLYRTTTEAGTQLRVTDFSGRSLALSLPDLQRTSRVAWWYTIPDS